MRVLGVIPARGGSKGIPRKNMQTIGGVTLTRLAVEAGAGSKLDQVILSTDDREIRDEANGTRVKSIRRPDGLATDSATALDVILHALNAVEDWGGEPYDAVMMLQPTTPFRNARHINKALELLKSSEALDSVISVTPVTGGHPARMKFVSDEGILIDPPFAEAEENLPRQLLPKYHIRNGAVYLSRTRSLRRNSLKGNRSAALIMTEEESVNIDTPFDLALARFLASGCR